MTMASQELKSGTSGLLVSLGSDTVYTSPTRAVRATGTGVIGLAFVDTPTTYVLWPFLDGETQCLQVTTIRSTGNGTTCTGVSVVF